ncbi:AAA family ATPase [uncultured Piscinibacter sp.]|uniref:McrB family protein n=1 Tax=uncultured Piscinibacter sp. TaxID=1131835 RepID=UPI002610F0BA|nr:AAA family ATPase [uncultured Piscinibacter sp.]
MTAASDTSGSTPCWFVGASFGGTEDQTQRFLAAGIWEIRNPTERDAALVKSMRPGERIAIKSSYVRKRDLPFDNRGHPTSVLAIKAIGTIVENTGDGERVSVKWSNSGQVREWYFFTYRATIWRVVPGDWMADGLIRFAFEGEPQDINRFRNEPYWRERFGSGQPETHRFGWTKFYAAVADGLLAYRDNRKALVAEVQAISNRVEGLGHLAEDRYVGGGTGFVRDICPFTTMGLFNRGLKDSNRKAIAAELAKLLDVDEDIPESFEGIPLLNNLRSWYFPYEVDREPDHIDALWDVFAKGLRYADSDDDGVRDEFAVAFDRVIGKPSVAWNLTFGLYWARPWSFLSLDHNSQVYVEQKLGITVGRDGPKKRCSASNYLAVMDLLEPRFKESTYPVHSYPELSLQAWLFNDPGREAPSKQTVRASGSEGEGGAPEDTEEQDADTVAPIIPYSVDDIVRDGCFLDRTEIETMIGRLKDKKNIILQGPPGTGKSWLAKKLAFALMGQRDESKVRAVQFHPNLSYEDFVRGYRPSADGKLLVVDGVFLEAIASAARNPESRVVVIVEEINRGNPAQVFGELLTLLEAGKRTPDEALELCYPDTEGKRRPVHIPENLYVIGTMNIADRSLALVDFALRRRFAFVNLEPRLGSAWRTWVTTTANLDPDLAADLERRIEDLNKVIADDSRLGPQFRVGHSYVTPTHRLADGGTKTWFKQVVETEIGPLLDEYWFDAPDEARRAREKLLTGW